MTAASRAGAVEGTKGVLLLPAGPSDRVVVAEGRAVLLRGGEEPSLEDGVEIVAVDLPDRAPAEAIQRGVRAEVGLGAALLSIGAGRIAAGGDDIALLVPEYVTLPRGIAAVTGEVRWSNDPR